MPSPTPTAGSPAVVGGRWFQWHYDRWTLPLGARLLASTPGANQSFRIGRTVATQFHPEVTAAIVARWAGMNDAEELRAQGIDAINVAGGTQGWIDSGRSVVRGTSPV